MLYLFWNICQKRLLKWMVSLNAEKKSSWKIFSWLYCPAVVTREGEKSKPVWNLIPFCSSFIYYSPCSAHVWGAPRARLSDKHDMNLPYANPAAHFPYGQRYHISLLSRLHIRIRPSRPNSSYCIHVQSNATNPESCNISERETWREN